MKKIILLLVPVLLIAASCKKQAVPAAQKTLATGTTGTVIINGATYTTIVIGSRIWTTQNYSGTITAGKYLIYDGTDASISGEYYYNSPAVALPAGWRIPGKADFNMLLSEYSSTRDANGNYTLSGNAALSMASTSGWAVTQGNNATGFNAYPAGFMDIDVTDGKGITNSSDEADFLTQDTYLNPSNGDIMFYEFKIRAGNPDYTGTISGLTVEENNSYYEYASLRFVKDNN